MDDNTHKMNQTHAWEVETFMKFTWCELCDKVLWGFRRQGVRCCHCKKICHPECSIKEMYCNPALAAAVSGKSGNTLRYPHNFFPKYFTKMTYCNICRDLMSGIHTQQGVCCGTCRVVSHFKCQELVPAHCRAPHQAGPVPRHHWVEGNIHQSPTQDKCLVCRLGTGSTTQLIDFHCAWCSETVHSACFSRAPEVCSLGPFKMLMVSPLATMDSEAGLVVEIGKLDTKPLVCFINKKSGGGQGEVLLRKLRFHLNGSVQVFDLGEGGPRPGLSRFAGADFNVLVCGGDGTVNWVLETIRTMEPPLDPRPAIAVLPLGTGNDLARVMGWGPGYSDEAVPSLLKQYIFPGEVLLDRWKLSRTADSGEPYVKSWNNYFSIGIDADVLYSFHTARETKPHLFPGRNVNKLWYAQKSIKKLGSGNSAFASSVKVEIDGEELPLDPDFQGLLVMNVPSYASGSDLWGNGKDASPEKWKPQSFNDGLIEILAISGILHMASAVGGVAGATRLAQCRQLVLRITGEHAVQIDGEPWLDENCTITIDRLEQSKMLFKKE